MLNLQAIDTTVFYFINHHLQNPVFDRIMPIITYAGSGAVVWFLIASGLYFFVPQKGKRTAVLMVIALLLSTLLANEVVKYLFIRPRPFVTLPDVRLLISRPGSYSFPSGHAATSFACAVVIAQKIKPAAPFVLLIALAIAFSRVYVGVHYPLDIIGGAILGWLCALFVLNNEKKLSILSRREKKEF